MEEQKKPSTIRAIEAMTAATLLSAGLLAFIVWAFISWRPGHVDHAESASTTKPEAARKSGGLISAKVQATSAVEEQRPFDLEGLASVRRSFGELHYKWILPEDVKHLSGALSGHFDNVSPGDNFQVNLRVEGTTPGQKKLFFRVYASNGGEEVGQTAVFLTGKSVASSEEGSQKLKAQGANKFESPKAPRSQDEFRRRAIR